MSNATEVISFAAAFVAGIAGSAHCFAMCGALAGAFGMRARAISPSANAAFGNALWYHAGRLSGYTVAGALCGLFGATLQNIIDPVRIGPWLRVASGLLLLLVALRILSPWNPLRRLETLGAMLWRQLQPLAGKAGSLSGSVQALALGLLWGWLPCGLVYSMLLFATLSGHAASGAGILLAFGLGTLPAMLSSSVLMSQTQRLLRGRWPRLASGALSLLFGVWMICVSMPLSPHAHH